MSCIQYCSHMVYAHLCNTPCFNLRTCSNTRYASRLGTTVFLPKIPENSIESLDESWISRWSLEVLNTSLSCFCSKSRLWSLRYDNIEYGNYCNPRTKNLDFRAFDSSGFLILRGGIPRSTREFRRNSVNDSFENGGVKSPKNCRLEGSASGKSQYSRCALDLRLASLELTTQRVGCPSAGPEAVAIFIGVTYQQGIHGEFQGPAKGWQFRNDIQFPPKVEAHNEFLEQMGTVGSLYTFLGQGYEKEYHSSRTVMPASLSKPPRPSLFKQRLNEQVDNSETTCTLHLLADHRGRPSNSPESWNGGAPRQGWWVMGVRLLRGLSGFRSILFCFVSGDGCLNVLC